MGLGFKALLKIPLNPTWSDLICMTTPDFIDLMQTKAN